MLICGDLFLSVGSGVVRERFDKRVRIGITFVQLEVGLRDYLTSLWHHTVHAIGGARLDRRGSLRLHVARAELGVLAVLVLRQHL